MLHRVARFPAPARFTLKSRIVFASPSALLEGVAQAVPAHTNASGASRCAAAAYIAFIVSGRGASLLPAAIVITTLPGRYVASALRHNSWVRESLLLPAIATTASPFSRSSSARPSSPLLGPAKGPMR